MPPLRAKGEQSEWGFEKGAKEKRETGLMLDGEESTSGDNTCWGQDSALE